MVACKTLFIRQPSCAVYRGWPAEGDASYQLQHGYNLGYRHPKRYISGPKLIKWSWKERKVRELCECCKPVTLAALCQLKHLLKTLFFIISRLNAVVDLDIYKRLAKIAVRVL